MTPAYADALRRIHAIASVPLGLHPTPIEEMSRLRHALGGGPRLLVKRDDAIPFGFGGNKVRKLALVVAEAMAGGADTLVTVGGIQSNHMRVTASLCARLGLGCHLIANGTPPARATGNALLDELLGAEVEYIPSRDDRAAALTGAVDRLRRGGSRPYAIPLGASTSLGALGFVRGVAEMLSQGPSPDVVIHASSSGGTQAGIVAGCALHDLPTRVIGVSADDPATALAGTVHGIIEGIGTIAGVDGARLAAAKPIEVDDTRIGDGYGLPTPASREAQQLAARTEALFVDHTYTAKALGALIAGVREGRFRDDETVLFWHTGGQPALFA